MTMRAKTGTDAKRRARYARCFAVGLLVMMAAGPPLVAEAAQGGSVDTDMPLRILVAPESPPQPPPQTPPGEEDGAPKPSPATADKGALATTGEQVPSSLIAVAASAAGCALAALLALGYRRFARSCKERVRAER